MSLPLSIGNELVTYPCVFTTKTYQTPSSKLRLLFYKALYSNGFNRFAYFCFLLIFFFQNCKVMRLFYGDPQNLNLLVQNLSAYF
ncbi:hypothetical protein D3C80_1382900 [compost metagenome]